MLSVGFIKNISRGFTLIEVLVVIAIISVLAGAIAINSADSNKQARDEKRQADLRALQSAIEMYKNKNGVYPAGCNGPDVWSGEKGSGSGYKCTDGTDDYIRDLAPEFIPVLPKDPKLNSSVANSGYVYMVNLSRTVYKLMVMNTVESETVTYSHPLKSCDINSNGNGINEIDTRGWCSYATLAAKTPPESNSSYDELPHCESKANGDGGDGRFDHSYGVWGGFEKLETNSPFIDACLPKTICAKSVRATAKIICK